MTLPVSRAIRGGFTVHFGTLQFVASVHSVAGDDEDAGLVRLCEGPGKDKHPPSRIRRTEACPKCGNADVKTFTRGRPEGGSFVVLTGDELEQLVLTGAEVKDQLKLSVHPRDASVVPAGGQYYLSSSGPAQNNYALVAELLRRRPDLMLLGEFAVKGSAAPYSVELLGDALVLREIARPEMVREAPENTGSFTEADLEMALTYVDAISRPFDPAEYGSKKRALVDAMLADRAPVAGAAGEPAGSIADQLSAHLEQIKAQEHKPARKRSSRRRTTAA